MTLHYLSAPAQPVARVLVVERDDVLREVLSLAFSGMGFEADCASGFSAARALLTQRVYRLVLTDLELADGDGLMLTRHVREHCPGLPVVVLTAQTGMESVVAALKAGAVECLAKPVSLDELRAVVRNTLDIVLPGALSVAAPAPGELLGESEGLQAARAAVAAAARLRVPVAIDGEPGTGKRLAARLIHAGSTRRQQPCVIIDCASAPGLIELFGAEPNGQHTESRAVPGLLLSAEGGTLVLHHVDRLAARLQVRLARVIESARTRRPGAAFDEPVDLRVIATSNLPLARAHAEGRLEGVLYYALDRFQVHMPSVRDRPQDIAQLAGHILARAGEGFGVPQPRLHPDALARLMAYPHPGNVREMECLLERALATTLAEEIRAEDMDLPRHPEEEGA